jgi:6-pyruvoyltetrahydropterin/6-carboxytetrahydropterin synthase
MPYRICKTVEIESGHILSRHSGKCRFPHGHTRKVELVLEAESLDDQQMVCDFKAVKEAMKALLDPYDHAMCVNTDDPMYSTLKAAYGERVIGFEKTDPTSEMLAKTIFEGFRSSFDRPNLRMVKVRVWETADAWAEYWE